MAISVIPKNIPSTDGIHTLRGKMYIPEGHIRGMFQISHGMVEHIERYADFMRYLAENGFLAFAHDHVGHGKTAETSDELGFLAEKDGWKLLYRDVIAFAKAIKADYPHLPLILMGHSMGSFIARNAMNEEPDLFDAVIIMGTGGPNPVSRAGLFLARTLIRCKGKKHISNLLQTAAFGSYNKKTASQHPSAWLTRDEEILKKHACDPLCNYRFTVSAMHDLITMQDKVNQNIWFEHAPKNMPILLISGEEDPVGNYGKGVRTVYQKLCQAGARNVSLKLYPHMRHEVLNEIGRQDVYRDILTFLSKNF